MTVERAPGEDFDTVFASQFPVLVRTLGYVGHEKAVAEELAQDAFVQLYRHWAKVSAYDRPDLWVRTVALRAATRARRRRWQIIEREKSVGRRRVEVADLDVDRRLDVLRAVGRLTRPTTGGGRALLLRGQADGGDRDDPGLHRVLRMESPECGPPPVVRPAGEGGGERAWRSRLEPRDAFRARPEDGMDAASVERSRSSGCAPVVNATEYAGSR